jgi:hypothetical protein
MSSDGDEVSIRGKGENQGPSGVDKSDREDMKALAKEVKEQMLSLKKEAIRTFLAAMKGEKDDSPAVVDPLAEVEGAEKVEGADELQVPEYWNAENTSQRIVDFALSFYGAHGENGQEFYDKIKGAIDEGFKEARSILGELPEGVSKLADSTYKLTMEKLDSWAKDQGIIEG